MAITRREAREAVFTLLFETDFRKDEERDAIYEVSVRDREIEENEYIKSTYFGVCEHQAEIDGQIDSHSNGWKLTRISRVSRAILRLCVFEMLYCPDIPSSVSLNEAVELCKLYDDEKARPFLNGVLNAIKNEIEGSGAKVPAEKAEDTSASDAEAADAASGDVAAGDTANG